MTDDRLGGLFILIIGLINAVCADAIGRLNAMIYGAILRRKINARPFQKAIFFGGLLFALLGLLISFGVL